MDERPSGRVRAGRWELRVDAGRLLLDGVQLDDRVDPRMAVAGDLVAYARDGDLRETDLWLRTLPDGRPTRLTDWPGSEDRPVFSPDGQRLAFVGGDGLPGWWVLDLAGGSPRRLSNTTLGPRRPGRPPEGWMPLPSHDYAWDETGLHWVAQGRRWSVTP